MKARTSMFAVVVGLSTICSVVAQETQRKAVDQEVDREVHHHHYYGGGGPGYGYGNGDPQRGFSGGLASGIGDARLSTAEAADTYARTAHQVQENHNFSVNSYYANREEHDKYVEAHRRGPVSAEDRKKFAQASEPGRLSNAQFDRSTNVIHWPALLRDAEFRKERQAIDQLFNDRTSDNSGAASDSYSQINAACHQMLQQLIAKLRKDKLPSVTYICCEHFIKSVAYEGRFAVK